jgi:hypothetical protein
MEAGQQEGRVMGGSGGAIAVVFVEVVLVATAWFIVAVLIAGWQTRMAYRYGDRDSGYRTDRIENAVWFVMLFLGLNVLVFGILR